jgi:hypothetical protein
MKFNFPQTSVFADTRGSATTPNDYNDLEFKTQLKNLTDIWLNWVATWTYARLVWGRWQSSSTYGNAFETAYTDDGVYNRNWATTTWWAWRKNIDDSNVSSWFVVNWTEQTLTVSVNYQGAMSWNSSSIFVSKTTMWKFVSLVWSPMGAATQKLQYSLDGSTWWTDVYSFAPSKEVVFIVNPWRYYRTQANCTIDPTSSWTATFILTT